MGGRLELGANTYRVLVHPNPPRGAYVPKAAAHLTHMELPAPSESAPLLIRPQLDIQVPAWPSESVSLDSWSGNEKSAICLSPATSAGLPSAADGYRDTCAFPNADNHTFPYINAGS